MALFKYHVVNRNGNEIRGEQEAGSEDKLARFLQEQGYVIIDIEENVNYLEELFQNKMPNVSLKNKVLFAKQIATMIGAGLPLTQVLEIVIQQTKDEALKKNLENVLNDIEKGGINLSDAMQKNTKMFNDVQLNLIRAGEASGNLFEMLQKVADDLEKSKKLSSKIRGAMIYPAIIFVVIVIVVAVMIMYMVPAVEDLYADFGVEELPWVTSFLVSLSHFLSSPIGCSSVSIIVVSIVFGYKYYYSTESGRLLIDKLMLKLPIFGQLISKVHIAEFSRLLSMLLKSGVSIVEALQIVSSALNNIHFKNALLEGKEDIKNGLPIAVALSKSEVYPPLIVKMVAIGEETGKLDSVLEDMAKFYDDEVNEMTDNLNKLMEPMILIIVGGVVAFLAIGIYLPIYSIGQSI